MLIVLSHYRLIKTKANQSHDMLLHAYEERMEE